MATKSSPNLKIKGERKIAKLKKAAEAENLSDEKSVLVEEQDSLYYEKGLNLNDEQSIEMKFEKDELDKEDNINDNKSSPAFPKKLKRTATAASTPTNIVIKKEIITTNEDESPSKVPTPIKPANAGEVNGDDATAANQELSDENKKESNNVIRLAVKGLSDEERKQLRAKRFNIIAPASSQSVKTTIPKKVPKTVAESISNPANNPTPTYNVLKKRAERFGENVSTVMKNLDHKEKMLKRKLKFLESVTDSKEEDIKKKRAERFLMI